MGVTAAGSVDLGVIRKLLEISFLKTKIDITLFVKSEQEGVKGKKPNAEVEIIKVNSGLSYADMVSKMKENINPASIGVKIKNMKKSNNGELLIVTDKGPSAKLMKEMQNKATELVGINAKKVDHTRPLMITGMDGTTTEQELADAIEEVLGKTKEETGLEIKRITQARWGRRVAEVWLNTNESRILEDFGEIEIGWGKEYIKNKKRIDRCIKCLNIGHRSTECRTRNATPGCFRCTKPGHSAKDCQEQPRCNVCKVDGHRPDSARCPSFRNKIK